MRVPPKGGHRDLHALSVEDRKSREPKVGKKKNREIVIIRVLRTPNHRIGKERLATRKIGPCYINETRSAKRKQ